MGMEQKRPDINAEQEKTETYERPLTDGPAGAVVVAEPTLGDMAPMDPERNPDIAARPSFWADNRGVGVVEMILILVVLIALVIIFKTQLTSLVKTIFNTITKNANTVLK